MNLVKWTAYACFGLAGLGVILAMANEAPALLVGSVSALVLGVGFLAAHFGLSLLVDIRNALVPQHAPNSIAKAREAEAASLPMAKSAAELSAEIKAMAARAP